MNRHSRLGKAASRKIRYSARRRAARTRRFWAHLCLGTFLAILASLPAYQSIVDRLDPPDSAAVAMVSGNELTSTPSVEPSAEATQAPSSTPTDTPQPSSTPTEAPTVTPSPTPLPSATPTVFATKDPSASPEPPIMYYTQAGDTLPVLAIRFGVSPDEILSSVPLPEDGFINPNQLLLIPRRLGETSSPEQLIPDSEVVFSPSAAGFDIEAFVKDAGGYFSAYREELKSTGVISGAKIIRKIGLDNSIHPRLLLALLEFQSHWVYGQPASLPETYYPMGNYDSKEQGFLNQLNWAIDKLSIGYYKWRDGTLTSLTFPNGETLRLAPELNAGTVAVQYLFSQIYNREEWAGALYDDDSFATLYEKMYGNPWLIAQTVEPLLPATLTQPDLELPFVPGQIWSFSGGPHAAWNEDGARAALDFAPASVESGCVRSNTWATAVATGQVIRSENGVVILDLDGDGREETGWVILYLHVATEGRVPVGKWVSVGDVIGHPSCEGGLATGTHIHIARKYNGEWVLADGPLPFVMSGWEAHAGEKLYQGTLTKGDQTVIANTVGSIETNIIRPKESAE